MHRTFDKGPPRGPRQGLSFLLVTGGVELLQVIYQGVAEIHLVFKWHSGCSINLPEIFQNKIVTRRKTPLLRNIDQTQSIPFFFEIDSRIERAG
jgi:hypothetical protein